MHKIFLSIGAILGGLAVVLGAFGAHGLRNIAGPETVAVYEKGVQYQMYHALALILTGILSERMSGNLINYAGVFFISGIVFFSGSLYLIASLKAMNKVVGTGIGIITPIGGTLFITGWIFLVLAIARK